MADKFRQQLLVDRDRLADELVSLLGAIEGLRRRFNTEELQRYERLESERLKWRKQLHESWEALAETEDEAEFAARSAAMIERDAEQVAEFARQYGVLIRNHQMRWKKEKTARKGK